MKPTASLANQYKKTRFFFVVFFLAGLFFLKEVGAQAVDTSTAFEVLILKGELVTLDVYALTRVSLTDPSVTDIVEVDDKHILLIGKTAGQTPLFIWDEHGKRTIMVYVFDQNLELIKTRLEKMLEGSGIEGVELDINNEEGKVVATGEVSLDKQGDFDEIVNRYGGIIFNLVKAEEREDLIQIDLQITELKETLNKAMGIDWSSSLTYKETLPTFNLEDGNIVNLTKYGDILRTTALQAKINALITEGKGRVLSQPRLVVVDGEAANFLVGGEVPIKTTTTTESGVTQENVNFKDYGISMNITPTIKKDKIDIVLNASVSDIDTATADSISETVAFSTRSASTRLLLSDGQLVILAGLIKQNNSETINKVPFLGDVPVLGLLFRSRTSPAELSQELVISLRPSILTPQEEDEPIALKTQNISSTKSAPTLGGIPDFTVAEKEDESESISDSVEENAAEDQDELAWAEDADAGQQRLRIPKEMTEYVQSVQKAIAESIQYPREAENQGWEGTVRLGLLILRDGTLAFVSVKESSGYPIFDEYALKTAKNVAPYAGFPANLDLQELNVTVPIVYTLNGR